MRTPGSSSECKNFSCAWNRTPIVQPVFSYTHMQMTATTSCRSVGHRSRVKKAVGLSSATALQHCSSGQRGVFCATSLVSFFCEREQHFPRSSPQSPASRPSWISVVACVNWPSAAAVCEVAKRSAYIISKKLLQNKCSSLWLCYCIRYCRF